MTSKQPDNHPDELLVWYANDTLEDTERAGVDDHLRGCARCRDEIVFLRSLRRGIKAVGATATPGELGLKRLLRDVRARQNAPSSWWRPALAAATVVIVAQAALLTTFWPREPGIVPLGELKPVGSVAQIQFQPQATEAQIRSLLIDNGATLIGGPGAVGVYRIRLDQPDMALTQLRARTDVVKHVAAE